MSIPIYISVRLDSSRLPAKCLLEISPGITALSFVVQRGKFFGLRPILCTDEKSYEDGLEDFVRQHKVEYLVGPKENKLKRWSLTSKKFGIEKFHSVDADDPYYCSNQIKKSFELGKIGHIVHPSVYSDSGGATEGYTLFSEDIQFAESLSDDTDTSFIKPYLEQLIKLDCPNPEYSSIQTRLTLDYLEDFIYLRFLGHRFSYQTIREEVERYIVQNQYLKNIHLNDLWKKRQLEEGEKNYHGKI